MQQVATTKLGKGWDNVKVISRKHNFDAVPNSEVLQSQKYDIFKFDTKNRQLSDEKVTFFVNQFKQGKFFMYEFPVIVSKDLTILDGQHRFEASRRLGLTIYFRYAKDFTIEQITDVQINAGWKPMDYLHAFVRQGNQNYIILSRFIKRYNLPFTNAINVLTQQSGISAQKAGYYNGTFKVKDEDKAHIIAQAISEIRDAAPALKKDKIFFGAILRIIEHPEFDKKRMISQIEKYPSLVVRQVTVNDCIKNLEEVFSYKLYTKNKVRFI